MKEIYLDYAATTPVDSKVLKEMIPYFTDKFENASSIHSKGLKRAEIVKFAKDKILEKLNTNNHKVIFTSGGTESNNLAIKGLFYKNPEKNHIIVSKIEHDCVLNSVKFLEKKENVKVTYLDVNKEGFVNLEQLKKSITNKTLLVSIMHANNEIGTLQDLDEISKICREKKVLFHTDAAQSFTKQEINLEKTNIDLITINAHKIYGPKGIGALVIKDDIKLESLLHGGAHEYNMRSGTINVSGIVGFLNAIDVIKKEDIKHMKKLRDYLIDRILTEIPNSKLNGPKENRLINNTNFSFKYIEGESILMHLDLLGIYVSTGSACSSNTLNTNHVLSAIKLDESYINGAIRITLGKETTKQEIDFLIKSLKESVEKLTKMSPF